MDVQTGLILGNSITLHSPCSYWWGSWGMAASSAEHDFVHILANMQDKCPPPVRQLRIFNFYQWEVMAYDRAETLSLLENILASPADFVVLQLGENIADTTTLAADLEELLHHLISRLHPKKLLVLGNFWANEAVDDIKQAVCKTTGATYISLKDLQTPEYMAGLHTIVQGADGTSHEILHAGVARHPGDAAMKEIARRINDALAANE